MFIEIGDEVEYDIQREYSGSGKYGRYDVYIGEGFIDWISDDRTLVTIIPKDESHDYVCESISVDEISWNLEFYDRVFLPLLDF